MSALVQHLGAVRIELVEGKGRGVIAARAFESGDIISVNPVLVLDERDFLLIEDSTFGRYVFHWPYDPDGTRNRTSDMSAMSLGVGSLYNTSKDPNADWRFNPHLQLHTVYASRAIAEGEEICINYNWSNCDL